jgi:uncharacterized protein YdcH (DUF465 family)
MGVLNYKTNCRAAASVQNVSYILREDACAVWETYNIEEIKSKTDALSYAERRAWEEELKPLNGAAERRNHQRMELTFTEETDPDRALAVAKNFLKQEFPEAKCIIAAHVNTKNLHVHVWMDCRKTDGKKVHLRNAQFKTLDDRYAKLTDQIYGTNYAEQFKAQKIANMNEREMLKATGRSSEIVRKQNLTWKIRKEASIKNEQRTTLSGKHITSAAGRTINESSRRIAEIEQLDRRNRNQSELERIGRSGMERIGRENDRTGSNPIRTPEQTPKKARLTR